jgi:hypothetical protein
MPRHSQILKDTLLGFHLAHWSGSKKGALVKTEKFYLFTATHHHSCRISALRSNPAAELTILLIRALYREYPPSVRKSS